MAKTLKQFKQGYSPKAADEKKFVDKHTVTTTPDANGNDDKLFKASNVKMVDRETEHGYNPGSDEEVYEEVVSVDEKMNLKTAKMGDVIKDFQKSKAPQFTGKSKEKRREMAVAAKLQSEEIEQVDELSKETLKSYSSKNTAQRYHLAVDKLRNTRSDGKLLSKKSDLEWLPGGKKDSLLNKRLAGAEKATAKIKQMGEDVEQVEEAEKTAKHRPGWMLRADKKLGDAAKQGKKMNQLMAKFGGKPEAGKTVKEGVMGDVPSTSAEKPKLWKPAKDKKWKVVHKETGKARGEWDKPVDAVKHLKTMPAELQKTHTIVKEEEQLDELSADTRKSYLLKAASMNRANPTKKRSMGINRAILGPKKSSPETQTEEAKSVVDKSGAVHTPMSRVRDLARRALKSQIEKHAQETAAEVAKKAEQAKKKANEEIDYDGVREYLLAVYENKSQEEKNLLNEMLETEEGTKLAFVVTYFSGE